MRGLGHSRQRESILSLKASLSNGRSCSMLLQIFERSIVFTNILIMDYMQSVATALNASGVLNKAAGIDKALSSVAKAVWTG